MSDTTTAEELTRLLREFMAGLREHIRARTANAEPETLIDRMFGAIAATAAALLLILPWGKGKDGLIGALLAAAARYLAKRTVSRAPAPR